MRPGFRFRFKILTIGSALVWILAAGHGPLLFAADEVIYWSADLRIYRSTGRQGAPTVVLTNLDEEGNRLEPEPEESGCNDLRRQVEASQPLIVTDRPAQSGRVSVIVNSGEGSAQPGGEVEGVGYEGGVVVVNINNLPPPVEQQAALPVAYPMFTYPPPPRSLSIQRLQTP